MGWGSLNPFKAAKNIVSKAVDVVEDVGGGIVDLGKDVVDTIGNVGQDVIDTVKDLGGEIDDLVNDNIPGGWATVAIAAGAYFGPEMMAAQWYRCYCWCHWYCSS